MPVDAPVTTARRPRRPKADGVAVAASVWELMSGCLDGLPSARHYRPGRTLRQRDPPLVRRVARARTRGPRRRPARRGRSAPRDRWRARPASRPRAMPGERAARADQRQRALRVRGRRGCGAASLRSEHDRGLPRIGRAAAPVHRPLAARVGRRRRPAGPRAGRLRRARADARRAADGARAAPRRRAGRVRRRTRRVRAHARRAARHGDRAATTAGCGRAPPRSRRPARRGSRSRPGSTA